MTDIKAQRRRDRFNILCAIIACGALVVIAVVAFGGCE